MGSVNTMIYKEDWTATYQAELDEPTKFKDIATVVISDLRVLHNPYTTDPVVGYVQRGTAYTFSTVTRTDDNVTLSVGRVIPCFIDRADLAQTGYEEQMQLAKRQAVLLNEVIETSLYADHANMTDFGTENLSGSSGSSQITVSLTNIDDIVTNLTRTIQAANGESLLNQNGGFIVWRPADFQILKTFAMQNGYTTADFALKNGITQGFDYMGFTHYTSNLLAANHVIAGVKKAPWVGILRSTYGKIMVDDKDPGLLSGISVVSRVDYNVKVWNKVSTVIFDVNVA